MTKKNNTIVINLLNIKKRYVSPIKKHEYFYALKNISLKITKGDKIGLTGDNGAGKTTLLKIIAGITKATNGSIYTQGKIVSLINLEAGFDEELTGRENIVFNSMLHGLSKNEAMAKERAITRFAGIGNFIDAPFYTYSSGMRFRLAFSIAMASKPDIVLIDEIFLAGDIKFQIKTLKMITSLSKKDDTTLIISSHHPLILRKFCTKFVILKHGQIIKGTMQNILKLTKQWNDFFIDVPETKLEKKLSKSHFYQR